MTAIRVLMVDDHRMFVECLRGMIEQEFDIEVIGVCYDGLSAVARCAEMQPDVVLMDFNMPAMTWPRPPARCWSGAPKPP